LLNTAVLPNLEPSLRVVVVVKGESVIILLMLPPPFASVLIVTWNNKTYLLTCLDKLVAQTFRDFEVILVDNGSDDNGMLDGLEEKYSSLSLKIEQLGKNRGFAIANNIGARLARGQWLALLNADAFPEPDWLERLIETTEKIPKAFFASRQIQAKALGFLDGEGDSYHISGLVWRRNYGLPVKKKGEIEEIFSPCAAAALYPRQAFLDVGGFDEDYFSYQEDVDLGFRLRLKGLRCFFVPQAVVHHVGSASTGKHSDFAIYHGHRNLVWTYVKNMPAPLFWIFLPIHLVANLLTMIKFFLTGHGNAIWRAMLDAARGIGLMTRKRQEIQQNRQVTVVAIYRVMNHDVFAPLAASLLRRHYGTDRE
jgi:GT2 family glycosyltransferase